VLLAQIPPEVASPQVRCGGSVPWMKCEQVVNATGRRPAGWLRSQWPPVGGAMRSFRVPLRVCHQMVRAKGLQPWYCARLKMAFTVLTAIVPF